MHLLSDNELNWSAVVANNAMNRERKATGVNSYEKDFKLNIPEWLLNKLDNQPQVNWLDLCCGKGNALLQTALFFSEKKKQPDLYLKGIDLIDSFETIPQQVSCLQFETCSLADWMPDRPYDLVTCCHGLHYLGDKLGIIQQIVNNGLSGTGLFIGQLDTANIIINNTDSSMLLKPVLAKNNISYNTRTKMIRISGNTIINFPFVYKGADDTAGPNYTRQPVVNSHYITREK